MTHAGVPKNDCATVDASHQRIGSVQVWQVGSYRFTGPGMSDSEEQIVLYFGTDGRLYEHSWVSPHKGLFRTKHDFITAVGPVKKHTHEALIVLLRRTAKAHGVVV